MREGVIQVGIPCADQQLCFWVGIIFGVFFFGAIAAVVFSVLRDKWRQKRRRQERHERSAKK